MSLELYIAGYIARTVFGPIVMEYAKDAASDWAKNFCKDSLKNLFSTPEGKKVAARAITEFLQAFDSELVGAGLESEAERKSYTDSLKHFLKQRDVRKALGVIIEDENSKVDHENLATIWAKERLEATPEEFVWSVVCREYKKAARVMLLEFAGFRDEINAVNAGKTAEATQRIAGVPPEFDTERYRKGLLDRYQNLKLESLESGGTIHNPIHLTKIFVQQNVRDCQQFNPRIHELPGDRKRALREKGAAGEELAAEEMEELQRAFFGQAARGVLEALNDRDGRLFVVLGDPGSGKSVLLEYLALRWATAAKSERENQPLPLLVELKAYVRLREKHGSLLEYLHHATDGCGQLDQLDLHDHLEREGGLFLLDGLDEIFEEALRVSVVQEIANLARRYAKARFVVSSRVIGYQQQTLSDAGFRHYMLQDLEPEQIADFITRWHDLAYSDSEAIDRNNKRDRLSKALERSAAIRDLAGNPLLLTLMALLNRNQPLPDDRVDLYEQASRLLLHQWDAEKALPPGQTMALYHKQAMLRAVAYKMQTSAKGLAGNAIAVQELEDTLTEYLRSESFEKPREIAAKLIEQLRERNFILCFLGDDLYAFVHRTFLEYFCASAFLWKFEKERTLSEEQLQAQTFDAHWQDEKWHEVLRLIAGQIAVGNPQFAGQLIESLLAKKDPTHKQTHLFLAAECLGEVRNRRTALYSLDARLLETLQKLTRFDVPFYYQPWDYEITQLVSQVRSNAVATIALIWAGLPPTHLWLQERATKDESEYVRQSAVSELARGWHDDPATLPWLQERATKDESGSVRHAAVRELARGWHDDPATLPWLQERATKDEIWNVRQAAVSELARGWHDDPATLPIVQERATKDEDNDVRQSAVSELARGWHDDPATLPIVQERATKDESGSVRQAAVRELARGWHDDPATLPIVQERATKDESEYVRQAAVSELARGWHDDPEVQKFLAELKEKAPELFD